MAAVNLKPLTVKLGREESLNIPIQDILAPEDLLTRLTNQGVADVLLALMQPQLVADANRNTSVAQQTSVIGLGHTMDLCQNETLQSRNGNVGGEQLKGGGPILLEEDGVLVGPRLDGISFHTATREKFDGYHIQSRPARQFQKSNSTVPGYEECFA